MLAVIPCFHNNSMHVYTVELHCQDESKTIIGFYIQACSDDGKGQFDATFENMNIQHTSCQAPLVKLNFIPETPTAS